ncbi:hypothetical protein ACFCYM_09765 [Streptomyces sp. NPDC056254]|uniref:hypothetical protein n=1 Tax=Streptomyces sp. NPDC056254 TaxID=3345763 RepID=UPI0035D7E5A5
MSGHSEEFLAGWRAGYARGRDDEAAGAGLREEPDPPAERQQPGPARNRQITEPRRDR